MHRLVFRYYQRHSSFGSGQAFISFTWNLLWNLLLVLIQAACVGTGPGEFHDDDQGWQWSVWLIHDTSLVESLSLLHCVGLGKRALWNKTLHRGPLESTTRRSSRTPHVVPASVRAHLKKGVTGLEPLSPITGSHCWLLFTVSPFLLTTLTRSHPRVWGDHL